ncbi:MAG: AI-2E family transporter [Patescibacteria group bacterium]
MQTISHSVIARWFFLLLASGIIYLYWQIISPYIIVLITAAIAAVILAPIESRIRKVVKSPKLSAVLMILLVLIAIVGPLIAISAVMVNQINDIANQTLGNPEWRADFDFRNLEIVDRLPEPLKQQVLAQNPADIFNSALSWIQVHIGTIFSSGATALFKTGIFFICLFFFLLDRERIYKELLALSPLKDAVDRSIATRMIETVRGVVFGALVVAVTQSVVAAIGLTIFGVPGALIWAALVIITAQIPMLGNALIMGPAVAYLLLTGHEGAALGLAIWAVVAVGLIDNLLSPLIVGKRTRMHALLILLSILGGLEYFGPIGFILGPTLLAALLVVVELYKAGIIEHGASAQSA